LLYLPLQSTVEEMNTLDGCFQDVMQVCRNGHVVTDLLHTYPERGLGHCDRCGAVTLDRCPTCGRDLPGAVFVPGLVPVGRSAAPEFCSVCGAAFPWTHRPAAAAGPGPLPLLDTLLRRLPLVARQLRVRQGDRPPFRVEDERDLEDLVRALLPLHFDEVRPECRTPAYAPMTRTDFLVVLPNTGKVIAVAAKRASTAQRDAQLAGQLAEDVAYYERRPDCRALVVLVHDPEMLLREPRVLEAAWSRTQGEPEVHTVVAS
jgi:hypothetical protein